MTTELMLQIGYWVVAAVAYPVAARWLYRQLRAPDGTGDQQALCQLACLFLAVIIAGWWPVVVIVAALRRLVFARVDA